MVSFTSAAVVITGFEFAKKDDIFLANSFAPPRCPDNALITKLALSSMTSTAGSVFLFTTTGAISLITAPRENIHINASYFLNSEATMSPVCSLNHIISFLESSCLAGT
jgi:hypothetical protein